MKKIILIDGNNILFRSYYATAYNNNLMTNSKGFATNAIYGLVNMINKIISEEKPNYMAVAFDVGKNFRHDKYEDYKKGRIATPKELLDQFPVAKDVLKAMGIKTLELVNYEADDIIGTLSLMAKKDEDFIATIISSDKDLLQLINDEVDVKLLKTKDYIRYNESTFMKDYGIKPIRMIDLKALMGDPSDNVVGVKGIGEKTALKLLQQYDTIENIYDNIDEIKGAIHDKLVDGKESAFFSKEICTICLDVPLDVKLEDLKYLGQDDEALSKIYEELEFYSFLKKLDTNEKEIEVKYEELTDINILNKDKAYSYYIECDKENYHNAKILGMGLYDGENLYFVKEELIKDTLKYLSDAEKYTYDLKKNIYLLNDYHTNTVFDTLIAAYLLNYQVKDDLAVLMNKDNIYVPFYEEILENISVLKKAVTLKAKYIYEIKEKLDKDLKIEEMSDLFYNVEMPLINVLARMEANGIICDKNVLKQLNQNMQDELDSIAQSIYDFCGEEFNISSIKQLGVVLFDHMKLPYPRKKKEGEKYSTDSSIIEHLTVNYPEAAKITEYRNLLKLKNTYLDTLPDFISIDGKIHTTYKQALTRTGRLSSMDPNLQNIPTRNERGKLIRKAFIPENDLFLSVDYSQIELRILAHLSKTEELINAFINDEDIHTSVASDIFNVPFDEVTKEQRRACKAVVFGIIYGISGFGLGENLQITPKEAKKYIDKFYELYPGIKSFMDNTIKEAHLLGHVRTLFNRKRVIDELSNTNYLIRQSGERMAMNTPIQGTCADILKMAMIKIDKIMQDEKMESKMLLQVHDELIFDVKNEEKEKLEKIVTDTMENIVKLDVPLKVSVDYGINWYDAK